MEFTASWHFNFATLSDYLHAAINMNFLIHIHKYQENILWLSQCLILSDGYVWGKFWKFKCERKICLWNGKTIRVQALNLNKG